MINHFPSSTQFFYWLAKDAIEVQVIAEKLHEEMYERIMEYTLDGLKIFSMGGHLKLPSINEKLRERVNSPEPVKTKKFFFLDLGKFYEIVPEMSQLEKIKLSHTLAGSNYTITSQLYYRTNLSGSMWEIYDLPNLLKVYDARKARLKPIKRP